jgi:hypothetical protein
MGIKHKKNMKSLKSKKLLLALAAILMFGVMLPLTAYGQQTAEAKTLTVTQCLSFPTATGSNDQIVGIDSEKEIHTSTNIRRWFDSGITIETAGMEITVDANGTGTEQQFIVEIWYNKKLYTVIIKKGVKLKYKTVGDNAVILFDEAYCLPKE